MLIRIHFPCLREIPTSLPLPIACGLRQATDPNPVRNRFDRLRSIARERWRVVDLEQADLIIYPYHYEDNSETRQVALMARQRNLPCIFFQSTDRTNPADPPYGVVYRTSIYANQLQPGERAMPAVCEDLLQEHNGEVPLQSKGPRPSVGFCGYVGSPMHHLFYFLTGRHEKARGLLLRHRMLRRLDNSNRVDARLIPRKQFWAGVGHHVSQHTRVKQIRNEFVRNVLETQYTLCLRGKGNYSFRFYETLAAGRIPLFINTNCVLPLADTIDYRKHCLWVEEQDMDRVVEILVDFHARISDDDFQQMQVDNRRLWVEHLSPAAFFPRILDEAMCPGSVARTTRGAR